MQECYSVKTTFLLKRVFKYNIQFYLYDIQPSLEMLNISLTFLEEYFNFRFRSVDLIKTHLRLEMCEVGGSLSLKCNMTLICICNL